MAPIGTARAVVLSRATDIPDSVVSRYQFNEGSGTTATDSVGSNDGTISGATYTTTAQEGSHALDFDGADNEVDLGWLGPYDTDTFSVSLVVNSDNISSGDRDAYLGNYDGSFPQVKISNETSNTIEFRCRDSSNSAIPSWGSAQSNTWYHIVGVRDGDTFTLYVNDDQKDSVTNSSMAADLRNGNAHVGARADNNDYTDGIIDDVMFANGAWTASQVSDVFSLYNI